MHLDAWTLSEISLELVLGVWIKLFCDNGRIHWRDLVNDFLFWVPGVRPLPADGLTREVATAVPARASDEVPTALAAK